MYTCFLDLCNGNRNIKDIDYYNFPGAETCEQWAYGISLVYYNNLMIGWGTEIIIRRVDEN